MRRTDRLFAIAEYLRARRSGTTAEALAEHFEVSIRTIYRDLDTLRKARLPILGERGRGGGLLLDRSYSLPPINFTAREAAVLVSAGRWIERARLLPFIDTLRSAISKVEGALPKAQQREAKALSATLNWVGVPTRDVPRAVRLAVEEAWMRRARLHIIYDGKRGITRRNVIIDNVVVERTMTLLGCTDLELGEARLFRLHCIREARVVEPGTPQTGSFTAPSPVGEEAH